MTESDLSYITVAMPKGKLFDTGARMFARIGLECDNLHEDSRKLVLVNEQKKVRFIITKAVDLPTYVEYGAADIGLIGKDVLLEHNKDVYELLDLGFGFCRMVVAVPEALQRPQLSDYAHMRVATKYPRIAEDFFTRRGIQVEIIKLNGSIELGPVVGLSELIVDIVSTGRTLKENHLVEVADVHRATARLIANRVSFKMKFERIECIMRDLKQLLAEGEFEE